MKKYKALIIGGSAGSFQVITKILASMDYHPQVPIFLVLHRLKHVRSGFVESLNLKSKIKIKEPVDKERFKKGIGYLAPANHHMYFDYGNKINLSTEPMVNHSRPSIDLSFMAAAYMFQNKLLAVILSGANKDGAKGMKLIADYGGTTIVQDPADCQVDTMTRGTLDLIKPDYVLDRNGIILKLKQLLR